MVEITPDKFKPGDKFLFLNTCQVFTLSGHRGEGVEFEELTGNFMYVQPSFIAIPRNATKEQIEALQNILLDQRAR